MKHKIFAALIVTMLLSSACSNADLQPISTPIIETPSQSPKYLWVEYWIKVIGKTSESRCKDYYYIDGPGYRYEENILKSSFDVDFENSQVILGCGKQLTDPVGSGAFSNLYPIKDFPYTPNWVDFCQTITINSIDTSGMISAKVNNKIISLEIGQEWTDKVIDTSDSFCEKTTIYSLRNFGFINFDQIIMPKK